MKTIVLLCGFLLSCAGDLKGEKGDPGIAATPISFGATASSPIATLYFDGNTGVTSKTKLTNIDHYTLTNNGTFTYVFSAPMKDSAYTVICSVSTGVISNKPFLFTRILSIQSFEVTVWTELDGQVPYAHSCAVFP